MSRRISSVARRNFLYRIKRKNGKLSCLYCGRNDLIIGKRIGQDPKLYKHSYHQIATIDHLEPVNGDIRINENKQYNWVISCQECNNAKDDLSVEEFAKVKEDIIIPWEWRKHLKETDPEALKVLLEEVKENRKLIKKDRHVNKENEQKRSARWN